MWNQLDQLLRFKPKRKKQPKEEEPKEKKEKLEKEKQENDLKEEEVRNDYWNNLERREYEDKINELKKGHQEALAWREKKLESLNEELDCYKKVICEECKKKLRSRQYSKRVFGAYQRFVFNSIPPHKGTQKV